jgi:tetratricopeptide (TPR) repeat protein
LAGHADDVEARVVLGRILNFDGRPDEAVAVWEAGLESAAADYPLLLSIGEVRARQGNSGPTVTERRGTLSVEPSKDKAAEEAFKTKHLALAAAAFERAQKLRPDGIEPARRLADVYTQQQKFDDAIGVWQSLVKAQPDSGEFQLRLGRALRAAKRLDEAEKHIAQSIALAPRSAEAYGALAELQQQQGNEDQAQENFARANFYKSLPQFATLAYSAENYAQLEHLNEKETVRRLVDDKSDASTELLAILCWSHPHNQLEEQAFAELEARGDATTPIVQAMLDEAHSTCTIKSASRILARRKVKGTFEFLRERLPGDLRGFGMDMDIAGALDELGDPRAVEPLANLLSAPGDASEPEGLIDRTTARIRAALALGAFPTPASRKALERAQRDPNLAPFCLAALYRQKPDGKLLADLEKSVADDDGYTMFVIGRYLAQKTDTPAAAKLSAQWYEKLNALEAARKQERKE